MRARSEGLRTLRGIAAGVVLGALALTAPAGAGASAPDLFAVLPEDRIAGEAAGRLDFPTGIAAEAELPGHFYVADRSNNRISVFSPWGEFVRAFGWGVDKGDPKAELQTCTAETDCRKGLPGSGTGQLYSPASVALDSAGDLYVIDRENPRVQKFGPEGELLRMWGWDVVASGPNDSAEDEFEVCVPAEGDACQAGVSGSGEPGSGDGQISSGFTGSGLSGRLAIGPGGEVFLSDRKRIERFGSNGAFEEEIAMPAEVAAIAVDGEGKLYASFGSGEERNVVRKIEPSAPYEEVEPKEFETEEDRAGLLALDGAGHLYAIADEFKGIEERPRRVLEFDPEGNCLDCGEEGEGGQSGFDRSKGSQLQGIATGAACGPTDVYVSHHDTGVGVNNDYLKIFGPHPDTEICPPPEVPPTIEASWAAAVDLREAELAASINPHFWADTTYQLQYGAEPCSEGGCETIPATPQVLSEEVTGKAVTASVSLEGLEPATTYHYRFLAKSTGSEGEEVRGVGGLPGADGAEGTFRTFAPPKSTACPNDAFRSGPAANLPDCRAYELVSPLEKNNGDVAPNRIWSGSGAAVGAGLEQSSVSGERLAYSSATAFADAQSSSWSTQYIAERIAGSEWRTHAISPPRGRLLGLEESIGVLQFDTEFRVFSPDLCEGWLRTVTDAPLDPAHEVAGSTNLYRRSDRLCAPGGADAYQALTTIAPADDVLGVFMELQGVAADGNTALYRGSDSLAGTGSPGALQGKDQLYVSGAGGTRFACLLPAGAAVSCLAGTTVSANLPGYWSSLAGAISADGGRVFWSTPALGGGAIYARENPLEEPSAQEHGSAIGTGVLRAGKTEVTSASASKGAFEAGQRVLGEGIPVGTTIVAVEGNVLTLSAPATVEGTTIASLEAFSPCTEPAKACTVPVSSEAEALSGASSSIFLAAAADGSRAIFLTKKEGVSDLYEFDLQSEATRKIASAAAGIMGASQDASITYFISTEAIEAADPNAAGAEPQPGDVNLYRYGATGEGSWRFIAALAPEDAEAGKGEGSHASPVSVAPVMHSARVSPDGTHLAFTSLGRPTGYDNTDPATGQPAAEAFVYDAEADGGEGKLLCASCNPSGARPRGARVVNQRLDAARVPGWSNSFYVPRALAEDGNRLFFESHDALSPRDANGAQDVYQWQAPGKGTCTSEVPSYSPLNGGCVGLISAATSPHDSEFRDADPSGKNVFFATLSSLVPHDYGLVDVYDARAGGGLPGPASAPPLCEGEACQSPPPAPADPTPASSAFRGPGNLGGGGCQRPARIARRAAKRAKRLRRAAKRAKAPAAHKRRLRAARRSAHRAKQVSKRARRCRRAARQS